MLGAVPAGHLTGPARHVSNCRLHVPVPFARGAEPNRQAAPWRKSGIWRYYPRPWVVYQGKPSDILVSGPGLDRVRIPQAWFCRKPAGRT
jgi:hypothetical protein